MTETISADNCAITSFAFEGASVRTVVLENGEPGFVAKDVCDVLGYANAADAMGKHCKGVAIRYPLQTLGGTQQVRVLNEPDVLRLIVRSQLPAAERFERWVFEDVLPAIRKTGSFGQPADPLATLNDPAALRGLLLGYTERVLALEHQVGELAPKAQALDRFATVTDGSFCLTDAAKALQVPPRKFIAKLQEMGWIHRRPMGSGWLAYQDRIAIGVMEHKVSTGEKSNGTEWASTQARVTAKGMARLSTIFTADPVGAA